MSIQKLIDALPDRSKAERAQMRANASRLLAEGTPGQQADAKALLAALDTLETEEQAAFIGDLKGMPVPERVFRAFVEEPLTDTEAKIIKALLDNPGSTSEQLSAACGWKEKSWHLHFGKMCEKREAYLWPAETYGKQDMPFWSGIMANLETSTGRWTMKPDVALALEKLGLRSKAGDGG
jgi:hypothetical protein